MRTLICAPTTRAFQTRTFASPRKTFLSTGMTNATDPRAVDILTFWFGPDALSTSPTAFDTSKMKQWFNGGDAVDEEIKTKFGGLLVDIEAGKLDAWQQDTISCQAGVILMDQFTRNAYRGSPRAFALDAKALAWAKGLWDTGRVTSLPLIQRHFMLLPFMHSEVLEDQEACVARDVALIKEAEALGLGPEHAPLLRMLNGAMESAVRHHDVIKRWGRFPHRNKVLGRENTPEEAAALADGSIPHW